MNNYVNVFIMFQLIFLFLEIITIKNISGLPLHLDIGLKSPFAIIRKTGTYKILPHEENLCYCISYNQSDLNMSNVSKAISRSESQVLIDYLTLKSVQPCRKSPLNFFEDIFKLKTVFNLTHNIEETLEDQEIMKIQLLLDTTRHTCLYSKHYLDFLRITCKQLNYKVRVSFCYIN